MSADPSAMPHTFDHQCFHNHLGPWAIEPSFGATLLSALRAGSFEPKAQAAIPGSYETRDGVAVIRLAGTMTKGESKFSGTSTIRTRRALRLAMNDPEVKAVLLSIDSPGGHSAGTYELAEEVRAVDTVKPVHAHIDDLAASAAYWVAAQARRVVANQPAEVGSIGVFFVAIDSAGKATMEGIKVHVVSSGPFKGAFQPGTEVTKEHLAYVRERLEPELERFLSAVERGREMTREQVTPVADGRVFSSARSLELGLIDAVMSFDEALEELRGSTSTRSQTQQANLKRRLQLAALS